MALKWSVADIKELIQRRTHNKFDANIVVSGARGNGKSTFAAKLLFRMDGYKPWKHQVYSRSDAMKLLESEKFGYVFDDEAINSGYKRSFYDQEQQKLIRMLNMYRDNFNTYIMAIPNFYNLDKDIRNLIFLHIHVIRRGVAVVHKANTDMLYSNDPWNIQYNKKLEDQWAKLKKKNSNFSPPYHKLSTFKGYLYFTDLSKRQRELYEEIKATKRRELYEKEIEEIESEDPRKQAIRRLAEELVKGHKPTKKMLEMYGRGLGYKRWESFYNILRKYIQDAGGHMKTSSYYTHETNKGRPNPVTTPNGQLLSIGKGNADNRH